jgi:hypothetical protein
MTMDAPRGRLPDRRQLAASRSQGGDKAKSRNGILPTLKDLGVTADQSSAWRQLADVPEATAWAVMFPKPTKRGPESSPAAGLDFSKQSLSQARAV